MAKRALFALWRVETCDVLDLAMRSAMTTESLEAGTVKVEVGVREKG